VSFTGKLAPGPDYKLYFAPENFIVALPEGLDPAQFNTVVVWCETFSMFISAARYR